jgi:hypothetical protein
VADALEPDTGEVLRQFLGSRASVTAITGTRIATSLTGTNPAIRYVLLVATPLGGGAVAATYQVECWGKGAGIPDDGTSDLLARNVISAVSDMAGTIGAATVSGGTARRMLRQDDDATGRPRNIVEVAFVATP